MISVTTEIEQRARLRDIKLEEAAEERERERARKNPPFIQLTERKVADLRKHLRQNPLAVEVFFFLSQHMDHTNIVICPMKVLMEEMEKSRQACSKAIRYLKENDLIEIVKFGNANGYGLNGEYVWKAAHHQGRYSVFKNVRALAAHSDNTAVRKKLAHIFQPPLPGFEETNEEDA